MGEKTTKASVEHMAARRQTLFGYFYGDVYHIVRDDDRTVCGLEMAFGFAKNWKSLRLMRVRRCRRCFGG